MGVPISFIFKYNPTQFELVGVTHNGGLLAQVIGTHLFTLITYNSQNPYKHWL